MENEIKPKWQSAGFGSQSEYDAYLDEKMAFLEKQLKDLEKQWSRINVKKSEEENN